MSTYVGDCRGCGNTQSNCNCVITPYDSKFSNFIRLAPDDEKQKVYDDVMRKVAVQMHKEIVKAFLVGGDRMGKEPRGFINNNNNCDCVGVVHTCSKIC